MKKLSLLLGLLLTSAISYGFHIVGGEIELIYIGGNNYNLNLIQYFDRAQTDNPGPEANATLYIFRNSDNVEMQRFVLPFSSETSVDYTNNECAIAELVTSKIVYTRGITLDPDQYSDPGGYHIVWERCCRNEGIVNIVNPLNSGMTYVLNFPPLKVNEERFINSSPSLLPPLSDYACINQLYYTDFRGTDLDGDSLTYEIVVPLNSSSSTPLPVPKSKNKHFPVVLSPGITVDNLVPGPRNLSITSNGFLTVTPENPGLYVFSVLVREFRDGIQIGSVVRDFQMLVIDGCNPPDPPSAVVKIPGDDTLYDEEAFVSYTVAEEKCFDFFIGNLGPEENASVRVLPVNFTGDVNGFTFTETPITADSSLFRVCVPECPLKLDAPYIIDLIAQDDACPLPQQDTVRLTIDVEPPPNTKPFFRNINSDRVSVTVNENESLTREFFGEDTDLDFLALDLVGIGFDPADAGISFNVLGGPDGNVTGVFNWDANCRNFDFTEQNEFLVALVLEDFDFCGIPGDSLYLDLEVLLPFNSDPEVSSTLSDLSIETVPDAPIQFTAFAEDLDGDEINLRLIGEGFDPQELGVLWQDQNGVRNVRGDFSWNLDCQEVDFNQKTNFVFHLVADDLDECRTKNFDSLTFTVDVVPEFNNKPEFLTVDDRNLTVNEPVRIDVTADDADRSDLVRVELLPGFLTPPGENFSFTPGEGLGSATGVIEWTPACELLGRNLSSRDFTIFLLASDNSCPQPKYDTIQVDISVNNLPVQFEIFNPPNVFTPNGDDQNDFFTLTGHNNEAYNLPRDNCDEMFQYMTIVDRSGREIYRTENRDFAWDGSGVSAGVYFYFIKYTSTEFRGSVTLIN